MNLFKTFHKWKKKAVNKYNHLEADARGMSYKELKGYKEDIKEAEKKAYWKTKKAEAIKQAKAKAKPTKHTNVKKYVSSGKSGFMKDKSMFSGMGMQPMGSVAPRPNPTPTLMPNPNYKEKFFTRGRK